MSGKKRTLKKILRVLQASHERQQELLMSIVKRQDLLEEILLDLRSILQGAQPVGPGTVSDDDWQAHIGDFLEMLANDDVVAGPPELNEGVNGYKKTGGVALGRAYAQMGSVTERWLLANPTLTRDEGATDFFKIDDDRIPGQLAPTHDLGTGYTAATNAKQAIYTYEYHGLPDSGPGAPPPGVLRRFYRLKTVLLAGGGEVEEESGRLYREVFNNPSGQEVWSDHWVLWPNYVAPRLAVPGIQDAINLRIERLTSGIPASADAFFAAERAAPDSDQYMYAHLDFTWTAFVP